MKLAHAFLLKVTAAAHPITIVNTGHQMIALMDDDSTRFVAFALIDTIAKLCSMDADVALPQEPASEMSMFRFDDSTPNVFGKVVWDTDNNSWKVSYKAAHGTMITYKGDDGKDLMVPDGLDTDAHLRVKESLYRKAIDSWNSNDKTKRQRITPPPQFNLYVKGSGSESVEDSPPQVEFVEDSPDEVDSLGDLFNARPPPSLMQRWDDDKYM